MDSDTEPRQLGSGRPERYEIDDPIASSPPHYTLLKAFDASHIFNKHPHKYDQLVAQEDGYSKDDNEAEMTRYKFSSDFDGVHSNLRTKSNSMTSLDTMVVDSALDSMGTFGKEKAIVPELHDTKKMVSSASTKADNMYRRCSLDYMADYYSRRSSDAAVTAIWDPSSQDSGQTSTKTTAEFTVGSYKHDKKKAEVFGERHLTEIMMKAAFQEPSKSPMKEESETRQKRSSSYEGRRLAKTKSQEKSQDRRMSSPNPEEDIQKCAEIGEPSVKMTTVQPKPRRLFGIGPLYNPLPETVVDSVQSSSKTLLMDRIEKEGLTPGKEEATRKKIAPTKAEVNTWAPFSM